MTTPLTDDELPKKSKCPFCGAGEVHNLRGAIGYRCGTVGPVLDENGEEAFDTGLACDKHCFAREVVRLSEENDRLRAELAETPATLEWLTSVLGQGDDHGGVVIWGELPRLIYFYKEARRTEIHQTDARDWEVVWTRAAVLAAVQKQETGQ